MKQDEVETILLPPERDPPRRPSLLPLGNVPQAPDQLSLSLEPPRAWFSVMGGCSK